MKRINGNGAIGIGIFPCVCAGGIVDRQNLDDMLVRAFSPVYQFFDIVVLVRYKTPQLSLLLPDLFLPLLEKMPYNPSA